MDDIGMFANKKKKKKTFTEYIGALTPHIHISWWAKLKRCSDDWTTKADMMAGQWWCWVKMMKHNLNHWRSSKESVLSGVISIRVKSHVSLQKWMMNAIDMSLTSSAVFCSSLQGRPVCRASWRPVSRFHQAFLPKLIDTNTNSARTVCDLVQSSEVWLSCFAVFSHHGPEGSSVRMDECFIYTWFLTNSVCGFPDSITEHIRPVYCMYSVLITNTHVNSI